jgi:hypothetical protein
MKKDVFFVTMLAMLSVISGYLMSKASWISKVGMTFFYKEYNLLKIWWQGAAAVFIFLLLLFLFHSFLQKMLPAITARLLHIVILIIAIACLYFTYFDFHNDFSHKLLGRRFHNGFYLIWCGWILTCLYFAFKIKRVNTGATNANKKGPGSI